MHPELLLLYFRLLQCLTHMVSVVPTSIAVEGPASYTVSTVITNVGALAVSIHASITSIQHRALNVKIKIANVNM